MTNFTDEGIQFNTGESAGSKVGGWDVSMDGGKDRRVGPDEFPRDDIRAPDDANPTAEQGAEGENNECTVPGSEPFPTRIISGVAGEFARLYSAHMEPPIEFFYMSFLTCLGNVLADRLTLASELTVQPRIYTLLLGKSADARKSTAISKTLDLFDTLFNENIAAHLTQEGFKACYGVGSAEGLQKRLNQMNKIILVYDEFKAFIGKCLGKHSVLLPCVNTLFELNKYENQTKTTSFTLYDAYLSLLGASTVETYERAWEPSFTDIGFPNRIFIVPAEGKARFSIPRKIPDVEKERIICLVKSVMNLVGQIPELEITASAQSKYDDWYDNRESSIHMSRLDTYALRLMLLLAVNDFKIEIDEETVEKALALVNWQFKMRQLYDPISAESKIARLEEDIRRKLRAYERLTQRNLRRHTNADRCGLWAFNKALENLVKAGDIISIGKNKGYRLNIDGNGDA